MTELKRIFIVMLTLFLAGCGAKFMYNNMDWLVLEFVDDYVTLTNDQESIVESRLQSLVKWHRESELPIYIERIEALRNMKREEIDQSFILAQRKEIKQHIKKVVSEVAPDIYALASQATRKQEQEFIENFTENQSEYLEKYLGLSDAETRELYRDKIKSGLNKWLGSITPKQQVIVNEWSQSMEITTLGWRAYQSRILSTLNQLFEKKSDTHYFQQTLMALLLEPESFYSDELANQIETNMNLSSEFMVLILSTTTDKQWAHFQNELLELQQLAEGLI
ncbi:DNA polymerase III subunit alpha [Vibrio sp. T187]|uniref:DUF6279 family lipoprotein n=1 Tax=Vibrio TaxID=662 RepID=UPI0010C9E6C2|nr:MULTISPECIES: DUF6279 family lipoprotein [Vibrio]MBW3698298.1 DNA polymerase III subunit alpha [Vibrio sp. T187]